MRDMRELPIPEAARKDARAAELLRVWLADEQQHVALRAGVWDDPAAWGLMLADIARHVANQYRLAHGYDEQAVLERVKTALQVELDSPTDEPTGEISEQSND